MNLSYNIFDRSMRAKARALGYSLSHKGLLRVNRSKHAKTRVVCHCKHISWFPHGYHMLKH